MVTGSKSTAKILPVRNEGISGCVPDPPDYAACVDGGMNPKPVDTRTEMEPVAMQTLSAQDLVEKAGPSPITMDQFEEGKSMSSSKYIKKTAASKIKKFYRRQSKEINSFETVVQGKDAHVTSEEEMQMLRLSGICANVTLLINVVMVCLKIVSAIGSQSSSVMASLIENFMDVISNIILIIVNFKVKRFQPYKYPHGKSRMEPIGVMLFAIVMSMTGFIMLTHAAEEIIDDLTGYKKIKSKLRIFDVSIFVATIVAKMICFAVMYRWKTPSIQALSLDHLNDSMVNFVAFVMAFVGRYAWRFADPIGALSIALILIFNWIRTVRKHTLQIIGQTAKPKWYRQLCWIVINNVHEVARPAYLRASTLGESYLVDVGLIMNADVTARDAAKICQSLRQKLEKRHDIAVAMVCLVDIEPDVRGIPLEAQFTPEPPSEISAAETVYLTL